MPKAKKSSRKMRFDYNRDRKKLKKKFLKKNNPRIEHVFLCAALLLLATSWQHTTPGALQSLQSARGRTASRESSPSGFFTLPSSGNWITQQSPVAEEVGDAPRNIYKARVWTHFGFYNKDGGTDKSHAICKMCFAKVKYRGNITNPHAFEQDVPMQDTLRALGSVRDRLRPPRCEKERCLLSRSFLPAAIRLYSQHCSYQSKHHTLF